MLRGSTRLLLSGATIAIRPSPPRHAGALRALHRRANTLATRRLAPDPAAFGLAASRSDLLRAILVSRLSPLSQLAQRYASTDRSKIEYTLQLLKEDAKREKEEADRKTALAPKAEDAAAVEKVGRMTRIWTAIKHELKHYWHGFRLLGYETRLSAKYLAKMSRGNALSRRERQQFVRTISDLLRMVPFSFFIIVPGAELLLPFYLKFFPSALPSTFQEASKEEEKLRKLVRVKIETAKLLQDTLEELALEKKKKASKSEDKATKESMAVEFAQFMKRVREEGSYVSNEELFRYSKLFEDELTLDSLAMSQLRALCKLLSIPTLGSPEILRFQLTMKLRELRTDDKQIALEGIDSLTTAELQSACRERGMRAMGVSEQRLREQLQQWLELSLNDRVPPSLLLLSRTLYMPDDVPFSTRLKQLVVSLPDGLAETTRQKLTEIEGGKLDYKARIALLKNIEEAIAHEKRVERDLKKAEAADEEKRKAAAAAAVEDEAKVTATTSGANVTTSDGFVK